MDQILEEKYECINPDLNLFISQYDAFNPNLEGQIDMLFEKEEKRNSKKQKKESNGNSQDAKPAPKGLDIKVVLRNKAIKERDLELYAKL